MDAFQKSLIYASRLRDSALLTTNSICIWTHCLPAICSADHTLLVPTFQTIVDCANKIGPNALPVETYAEVATVLAHGLIQPYLPKFDILQLYNSDSQKGTIDAEKSINRKTVKSPKTARKSAKPTVFTVTPEAQTVLKQANDIIASAAKIVEQAECVTDMEVSSPEYVVQRAMPQLISLKTRSRLIRTWLTIRQLSSTAPVCKPILPNEDRNADQNNSRIAQLTYRGSALNRALVTVYSIWLSNENTILTEWPNLLTKLTGSDRVDFSVKTSILPMPSFKDAPSLQEAVDTMKQAFFYELKSLKTNLLDEEDESDNVDRVPGREISRPSLSVTDRCVELELWTCLALYAIHTEQYTKVLNMTSFISLPKAPDPQSLALNYWVARLYDLRGVAVLGLAEQLRLQKFGSEPLSGKNRKTKVIVDVQIRPVHTLDRRSAVLGQAEDTVEASLFAAGEEAFYKATEFAVKTKRYDVVLDAVRHYWTVCNQPAIAITPDVKSLIKNYPVVREHLTNLIDELTQSLDPTHRAQLNEEIRAQTKGDVTPTENDKLLSNIEPSAEQSTESPEEQMGNLFATTRVTRPTLKQFEVDLNLRIQIYSSLFHVFEMECFSTIILIFDFRPLFRLLVKTKAMLDKPYQLDMQKFSNQSENRQAELWRELAYVTIQPVDQFNAFRQAIDVLKNPKHQALKAELFLEFSQWLYNHRFEATTCIELIEQAIDLLLTYNPAQLAEISNNSHGRNRSDAAFVFQRLANRSATKKSAGKQENKKLDAKSRPNAEPGSATVQSIVDNFELCQSVDRLDALVRSYVLLAEMLRNSGQTDQMGSGWSDYLHLAVVCVQQIWRVLLSYKYANIQQKARGKQSAEADKPKTNRAGSNKSRTNSIEVLYANR
ncbi:unnamed protein product [Echinostoma caproni]|uniref:Uncharacterized protein n=1 Tax=Echinostoma caproni TaxID=27848 RepID=A0A3P8KVR9_9TREM|nr:unnamed protein product [Echinostoma caproni]